MRREPGIGVVAVARMEAMGPSKHVPGGHHRRGIEIPGGFGPLAGKMCRIGLMGTGSEAAYVLLVLDALATALRRQGWSPAGDGVAAEKALAPTA